jgi:hypothetical protein
MRIILSTAMVLLIGPAIAMAGAAPPDFSGVYYPLSDAAGPMAGGLPPPSAPGQPLPPPTRSGPLSDGSRGRPANLPPLTEPYLAKWDLVAKSRTAGSSEFDVAANCLPPGMPYMMSMTYGMEIMQTRDKITFFSEWLDALRRVYLDGRKPTQKDLDDPTYAGFSTGHWEGDTLVVETVAIRADATLDSNYAQRSAHSKVTERIRLVEPTLLEDEITVTDPEALTRPWVVTRRYRKAAPPNDQLREFACTEGLERAK